MSLRDKLEIGLKPDAQYRPDNLPEHQQDDPDCQDAATPDDSPDAEAARDACDVGQKAKPGKVARKPPKP